MRAGRNDAALGPRLPLPPPIDTPPADALPIDALRSRFSEALRAGPVVVSAPTGSGKSTRVPTWCPGKVVVIEPRRVACRSLAQRVAEEQGVALGEEVGYAVRDEQRRSEATRILFVTPGWALRARDLLEEAEVVILDELHERRWDVDLLLGLLCRAREAGAGPRLVAMSATVDGDRVAAHLGGRHLEGEGRLYPVSVRHLGEGGALPHPRDLAARVEAALEAAARDPEAEGDVLVFLPGRGEIAACAERLSGRPGLELVELHGGLSLKEQGRAFAPARGRKVVLATNVAETSLTIPGIGVVIDSGLVRRTRYHRGRGTLTLAAIAADSAEQRRGRAGRTRPGVCLRLWSAQAILSARTPPEMHRESLVPALLAAAAAGASLESLPLLDPPKPYAIEDAAEELRALGALSEGGALTDLGRELYAQPLDPALARLLVEARRIEGPERDARLGEVIDLVSALGVGRPLFTAPPREPESPEEEARDPRAAGCDVVAAIRALREGEAGRDGLSALALREARATSRRLRRAHALEERAEAGGAAGPIDREALARLILRADPRAAYVARARRGRREDRVALSNGGTEVELGNRSAALLRARAPKGLAAALGLEVRALDQGALGQGPAKTRLVMSCAMPVPLRWLREAGLGRDRLAGVALDRGAVVAKIERVYARRVLEEREEEPTGELAREAIATLIEEGRLLRGAREGVEDRLSERRLAARLARAGMRLMGEPIPEPAGPTPELGEWLRARLLELGVERGEDAALLSPEDLWPPPALAPWLAEALEKEYPRRFTLGDASYEIDYDFKRQEVLMRMVRGTRLGAPPASYLPRFPGFRVLVEDKRQIHVVRERAAR